jgi:hypothetical protein
MAAIQLVDPITLDCNTPLVVHIVQHDMASAGNAKGANTVMNAFRRLSSSGSCGAS